MGRRFHLIFCGLMAMAFQTAVFASPLNGENSNALKNTVILIIRHAEKPADGYGLSTDGEARASAYVNYFKMLTIDGQPLKLDYMFAAADSKQSHRPRLTIEPAARELGLSIDGRFKDKYFEELAYEIKCKPHGKAILIAWHHENIPALLDALGANSNQVLPNGRWPGDVFGWLIQLRYDENGQLSDVKCINEHLLSDDSNKHTLEGP